MVKKSNKGVEIENSANCITIKAKTLRELIEAGMYPQEAEDHIATKMAKSKDDITRIVNKEIKRNMTIGARATAIKLLYKGLLETLANSRVQGTTFTGTVFNDIAPELDQDISFDVDIDIDINIKLKFND